MYPYQDKIISPKQAVDLVKSGDIIVTGLGAAEAKDFFSVIHTIKNKGIKDVTITNCLSMNQFEFFKEEYRDTFQIDGWFFDPKMRKSFVHGNVAYIPNNLHFAGTKRLYHKKPTIYVGSASWIDNHGFLSLSCSNTYEKEMIKAADLVILEMNKNFPRTFGDVEIHINDISYVIESSYPVPTLAEVPVSEKDQLIAGYIAEYINDGDTIQLGIGGIPNALAPYLANKKDLGIHTEMLTSNMAKLIKQGVITGARKTLHPGKHVATFIMGDKELYDYCHDNPAVMIMAGSYVNDPYVIAKNDNMVSINTTLEVDLTGQCASESIGVRQFSGTGGQADTAIGAQNAKNGKSFIALYSTQMVRQPGKEERVEISKIVPMLKPGAIVSLSRNDVDHVVTEYGVAQLRGTSTKERVERLIAIAHPKFREALYQEAVQLGLIATR